MLQFRRHGALVLLPTAFAVLASACSNTEPNNADVDGGVGGVGGNRGPLDSDFDGVPDDLDPCSTTLADATQLIPGCSASDIIQDERRLVAPIDDGIEKIRSLAGLPPTVRDALGEARIALGMAVQQFVDVDPCAGVSGFESVVDLINGAHMEMQDFLFELETSIPGYPVGAMFPDDVPAEATRYLIWALDAEKLHHLMDNAVHASSLVSEICDQKTGTRTLSGTVQSVRDDLRVVVLRSGEPIVLAPNVVVDEEDLIGEGMEVSIEATQLKDALLGTRIDVVPSTVQYIPDLTYDNCLQLRVSPRPDIDVTGPVLLDAYLHPDNFYDLERGMSFSAENRGCPTEEDLEGQGPGGVDMKIIYAYRIKLSYVDGLDQRRDRVMAFEYGDVNKPLSGPIALPPNIDPDIGATLIFSKSKRTCVVDPNLPEIGRYDPQSGEIGPPEPQFACSDDVVLDSSKPGDPAVYVRQPGYFCDASYEDTVFTLEDDEPASWEPTSVDTVVLGGDLPLPVTFGASGPKIVNGEPAAGSSVARGEPFAIYGSFSGKTAGSGLAAAHISGTRNGQPFVYSCTKPDLILDGIETIVQIGPPPEGACAFYRLPYPNGTQVDVNQGNGGIESHKVGGTQEWALDLDGDMGDPLIAARGGVVVRVVNGITVSCGGCGSEGKPPCTPDCPAYGNHVAVQHQDGDVSWYMHLVGSSLQVDDRIRRGDPIGLLGTTGRSTGPHLHFQATGSLIDSQNQINKQTVPIKYEIGGYCTVPVDGQTYTSTNEPN